ncbi:MAG: hypothetical protein QXY36_00030 [Sulfolobales archaeon]
MSEVVKYVKSVEDLLKLKDSVREFLIKAVRDITRESSLAITYVHLGMVAEAEELLNNLKIKVAELDGKLTQHPELKYSNLYLTAITEYVEAIQFFNLVKYRKLKSSEELEVHYIPYLQGMLDLVGELKRYALELVISGKLGDAWEYFNIANEIYESIKVLDYPEALIPGVRHKVDVARRVIEDLREFLIDVELRIKLINALNKALSNKSEEPPRI